MTTLYIALAGGLGATARFTTDSLVRALAGRNFPWGTLVINVSGAFMLGTVTGSVISSHGYIGAKQIFGTGFCGGFTTFSTASFEAVRLIEERRLLAMLFQVISNVCLSLMAVCLGMKIG